MSILSTLSRLASKSTSLDDEWSASANRCLFSVTDKNGRELFVSDARHAAEISEESGHPVQAYDIFAPDAFVRKVSGSIADPSGSKNLIAYIDGSYVQHQGSHASAYGIWCYCGDAQAEYAAAVCDNELEFGSMGGELAAAVISIKEAIRHGYKSVEIRHDFDGVAIYEDHVEQTPNEDAKMYWMYKQYESFLDCVRPKIDITFTKVKAHELILGNEHADFLAHLHSTALVKYMSAVGIANEVIGKKQYLHGHDVLWTPSTGKQKNWHQKAARKAKITCHRHAHRQLSCGELDRLIVDKDWSEKLGLTEEETIYLRYVACGAWDRPFICKEMGMSKKQVSTLRSGCAEKLGMNRECDIPQLFIQMVRVIGCGVSIEETRRIAAEKKAAREHNHKVNKCKKHYKKMAARGIQVNPVFGYLPAPRPDAERAGNGRDGHVETYVKLQQLRVDFGVPLAL